MGICEQQQRARRCCGLRRRGQREGRRLKRQLHGCRNHAGAAVEHGTFAGGALGTGDAAGDGACRELCTGALRGEQARPRGASSAGFCTGALRGAPLRSWTRTEAGSPRVACPEEYEEAGSPGGPAARRTR